MITVNPLLSPLGDSDLFISSPFKGGGGGGGLSVLHKEVEYKVEKLKNKKGGGHAAEDRDQIQNSS